MKTNRRSFLAKIFAGAVATPALARIVAAGVPKKTTMLELQTMQLNAFGAALDNNSTDWEGVGVNYIETQFNGVWTFHDKP